MVVAARLENSLLRPSAAAAAVAFHTFALTEYPSINFLQKLWGQIHKEKLPLEKQLENPPEITF